MYNTSAYNYSTSASYAAYLKSWGPIYFSGLPLGDYKGATVLPKLPGVPKKVPTPFGKAVGRKPIEQLDLDFAYFDTDALATMAPARMRHEPVIDYVPTSFTAQRTDDTPIINPSALCKPTLAAKKPAGLSVSTPTPAAAKYTSNLSPGFQTVIAGIISRIDSDLPTKPARPTTPPAHVQVAPKSPPPAPKRKRASTLEEETDSEDEIVVTAARKVKRAAPPQEEDGEDESVKLARQLQFEVNYGSRKRVRQSRGRERVYEL